MQFNSVQFIFYFLPLFLVVYFVLPRICRSTVLLLGSLAFYWFASSGRILWIGLLIASTLLTYLAGLSLGKRHSRGLLTFYLALMLGLLTFFKLYQGGKLLPAGMSFYLFQMAAYLIDIFRERVDVQRNLLNFGAEITMFPKLLSGPLMDPRQLQVQNRYCCPSYKRFHRGIQELILGLGLKVLLANRLGGLWTQAAGTGFGNISVPFAWMALVSYAMRLYFDFYGYSLMAIGLGKILGYELPENFLHPYSSRSVSEFYRRWHATLGAWFKEYLYFPLGGSRRGMLRTVFNLAVVWLFTGLWHGIGGNYLIWAGFLFLLIVNEKLWMRRLLDHARIFSHVYTVFVILLSWIPFAIGNFGDMTLFLGRLFGLRGATVNPMDFMIIGRDYFGILAAGAVLLTPYPRKLWEKIRQGTFADVLLFILFWAVIFFISTAAQDPFLYFQY